MPKTDKIVIRQFFIVLFVTVLVASGCGSQPQKNNHPLETVTKERNQEPKEGKIVKIYHALYQKAVVFYPSDEQKAMETVLKGLGEQGYTAVDEKNQINMENAKQVVRFCQSVAEKETANLDIVVAFYAGGFSDYHLTTKAGKVDVVREFYQYDKDGGLKNQETAKYPAERWEYTKEGYLIFEGNYHSDSQYALTLSDTPEQTMLRVEPLEERCRELNRRYLIPIGYARNNLFLTDWSEEDFGVLDFYDLFDSFYPLLSEQPLFSVLKEDPESKDWYHIPQEVFEAVVLTHFPIDRELLRSKTVYLPEDRAYRYRPRGIDDREYPEVPYPEVVNYRENEDGTITLTVNAVYPNDNTSKAFSHETVIRPLGEEDFQYVSNRMTDLEEGILWWHSDRQAEE